MSDYGKILMFTANAVGASLKKKMGSLTGYAPVDWAETINKLGNKLPERTVSGSVCSFSDGADDVPMPLVKASITAVQAGSGDPSPSNVRAISGFTTLNFSNVGTVNICDNVFEQGSINVNTGENTTGANYNRTKNYIAIKANQEYYCKSGYGVYAFFYDDSKNYLGYHGSNLQNKTFTPALLTNAASNGKSFALASFVRFRYGNGTFNNDFCVNYPSSDTTLHTTYAGETIPVSFGGQTIYGGELNLTTGVLTVTHGFYTATSCYRVYYHSSGNYYWVLTNSFNGVNDNTKIISSHFKAGPVSTTGSCYVIGSGATLVAVPTDQTLNTKELANEWLSTNQPTFVYELATPTTIQLTAEEVRSFLGTNNLWANTGDSEVTYFAQPNVPSEVLYKGQISTTSSYATANFTESVADDEEILVKVYCPARSAVDYKVIKVADIGNGLNVGFNLHTTVNCTITKTSISSYQYSGDYYDIYADILAYDSAIFN